MAEWTSHGYVSVDGKELEYACHGPIPGQTPTLVLLHEGLGCVSLWREFPQQLVNATGFGVLVFSRPGYGHSDPAILPKPLDYMTREAENLLPGVLDAMGIGRCILVGHSDGATIAAIYAGSVFDNRIRGLILMAPHFFTEPMGLEAIAKSKTDFEEGDLKEKLSRHHKNPDNAFHGWNDSWLHPDFRSWNVAEAIDHIRVPILAIQGVNDQYGTLAQIEEIKGRSYAPMEELILENCRHAPFLDQPDKVLSSIAEFCFRLERIEAAEPENA